MPRALPMFPLGNVLFPYALLPLHVFEPRYRALTEACLAGDREFGVVLIERGSEVGGGDTRFTVGTVAKILEVGRLPDGRYVLAAIGTKRLRVTRWLAEEPYPRADVELLDDRACDDAAAPDTESRRTEVERLLRRVLALRAELGDPAPSADVQLDEDVARASFEAAAVAPLGPLDAQRVLELESPSARLEALEGLLSEEARFLELRLAGS
ncbi:MAG: LON peptidase substrate-binding domain-containing protein [Actinomycetota bacterium]